MSAAVTLVLATLPAIAAPITLPQGAIVTPPHVAVQLRLAEVARAALKTSPRLPRNDCSGLVMGLLDRAGVDRPGDVRSYWDEAVAEGRVYDNAPPAPGDLVFFDRTYDANRNGRVDDRLSHIAVVASAEPDGTLVLVHRGSRGVAGLRMNLDEPSIHARDGVVLNDYLRAPGYGSANGPRLSGELFRAFAKPPMPRDGIDDEEQPRVALRAVAVSGREGPAPAWQRRAPDPLRTQQPRLGLLADAHERRLSQRQRDVIEPTDELREVRVAKAPRAMPHVGAHQRAPPLRVGAIALV